MKKINQGNFHFLCTLGAFSPERRLKIFITKRSWSEAFSSSQMTADKARCLVTNCFLASRRQFASLQRLFLLHCILMAFFPALANHFFFFATVQIPSSIHRAAFCYEEIHNFLLCIVRWMQLFGNDVVNILSIQFAQATDANAFLFVFFAPLSSLNKVAEVIIDFLLNCFANNSLSTPPSSRSLDMLCF